MTLAINNDSSRLTVKSQKGFWVFIVEVKDCRTFVINNHHDCVY